MNEPIQEGKPIYVFQLPIRIWHWSMVLSFLVLIPTGYIIGKPWHSLDGDPTYLFYMGYTRMAHFIAGFIITIGLLVLIFFMGLIPVVWGEFPAAEIFHYMSCSEHLDRFSAGLVDTRPVVFYLTMTVLTLAVTIRIIDHRRWKH